jgi:O-antigen ligase
MYLSSISLPRKLFFGAAFLWLASLLGWFVAKQAWVPLAGILGLALLAVWPAYMWLGVFLLLVPFDDVSGLSSGASSLTLTSLIGLVALFTLLASGLALGRLRFPSRPAYFWMAFIAWEACTVLWSVDRNIAIAHLPTMLSLIIFFLIVTCYEFSERELSTIARIVIFGGCIAAGIVLYLFHSGVFFQNMNMRASIVFGNRQIEPNVFSASLQLPLALVVGEFLGSKSLRGKLLFSACALLIALGIFATASRGALIAIAVMALFYVRKLGISWRALAAPVLLGGALLLEPGIIFSRLQESETTGGAGRLYIWQTGLAAFKDYFLAGAGLNNFTVVYNDYAARAAHFVGLNRPPHNVFLQIAVESGIIGIILFAAVIVSHFRYASRREPFLTGAARLRLTACEAAGYAMLASSFFLHLLWIKEFWAVWIMLAICSRAPREDIPRSVQESDELKVDYDAAQDRGVLVGS